MTEWLIFRSRKISLINLCTPLIKLVQKIFCDNELEIYLVLDVDWLIRNPRDICFRHKLHINVAKEWKYLHLDNITTKKMSEKCLVSLARRHNNRPEFSDESRPAPTNQRRWQTLVSIIFVLTNTLNPISIQYTSADKARFVKILHYTKFLEVSVVCVCYDNILMPFTEPTLNIRKKEHRKA